MLCSFGQKIDVSHSINKKKLFAFNFPVDPRTEHLPLTGSPFPIIGIVALYVMFVTDWGPKYMKSRPAYDLKEVIKVYNLIQIFTNLYIGICVSIILPATCTTKKHSPGILIFSLRHTIRWNNENVVFGLNALCCQYSCACMCARGE